MSISFTKTFNNVELFRDGAYFFHWAKGEMDTRQHVHSKAQFVYAEGGYLYIEVGSKVWFLPARHYMWIPAGVVHRVWSTSTSVRMYTIYFAVQRGEDEFYRHTGIYFVTDLLREMILYTEKWDGHVGKEDKTKCIFSQAIKAILADMNKHNGLLQFSIPVPKDERLVKIQSYVREHLANPISLAKLAEQSGMSGRTLSRLFLQDMGMSYIQFMKTIRIITAFELLVEHKYSIKEIAFRLGYSSVPTFSNTFFQKTGIRPTHYMRGEG